MKHIDPGSRYLVDPVGSFLADMFMIPARSIDRRLGPLAGRVVSIVVLIAVIAGAAGLIFAARGPIGRRLGLLPPMTMETVTGRIVAVGPPGTNRQMVTVEFPYEGELRRVTGSLPIDGGRFIPDTPQPIYVDTSGNLSLESPDSPRFEWMIAGIVAVASWVALKNAWQYVGYRATLHRVRAASGPPPATGIGGRPRDRVLTTAQRLKADEDRFRKRSGKHR